MARTVSISLRSLITAGIAVVATLALVELVSPRFFTAELPLAAEHRSSAPHTAAAEIQVEPLLEPPASRPSQSEPQLSAEPAARCVKLSPSGSFEASPASGYFAGFGAVRPTGFENDDHAPASNPGLERGLEPNLEPSIGSLPAPMVPPAHGVIEQVPVGDPSVQDRMTISMQNELLTLTARDAPLGSVLGLIAKQHGLNIITGDDVKENVTVTLTDVRLDDALDALLTVNGYTWSLQRNILLVSSLAGTRKPGPQVQGRMVRVFSLNYVSATDVDRVVKGLLSPVGQSFLVQTMPTDQRRTHEQVVVEDLPYYVARIEEYIQNIDYQPRQVVVEAHVLQVQLKDDCRHGVNFDQIMQIAGAQVSLATTGLANPNASPGAFLRINGTDLTAVIEALKSTTDAKTLASPKVAVLNGQEARMQVGGQIGYMTTTATETTAVQTVNFLDTGVILTVTPIITDDRQVLMTVRPEVSTGKINPTTNLPETETTQVETRVMLADGEAVVIGGLIREIDNEVQNKIPWLGDVKYIGGLFQRRTITQERSEVIITLLPRILSEMPGCRQPNPMEVQQSTTPLFTGPLNRVDRTQWEPLLPSASCTPRYPAPPTIEYGTPACEQFPQRGIEPLPPPEQSQGIPLGYRPRELRVPMTQPTSLQPAVKRAGYSAGAGQRSTGSATSHQQALPDQTWTRLPVAE